MCQVMVKLAPFLPVAKKVLLLIYTLLLWTPSIKGVTFQPIGYTFPDGLQPVNGSSSTGGCQEGCVMMPITHTTINGCVCLGNTRASGVLVDNDIPNIDTTQRRTWARGLFVVNRNGQNTIIIGFDFSNTVRLSKVDVTYFDCAIWEAGVPSIIIYSSYVFPRFVTAASANIGMMSFVSDPVQNCTSLRTVSISVQATEATSIYFVEFSYVGGSSIHTLNWLHLAEIRFSDVAPMMSTTTTSILETSEFNVVPVTTGEEQSLTTPTSLVTSDAMTSFTESEEVIQSSTDGTAATFDPSVLFTTSAGAAAIPVSVFVGTLVGVIAILVCLIVILLFAYMLKKSYVITHDDDYDYVSEGGVETTGDNSAMQMTVNKAYATVQDDNQISSWSHFVEPHYEDIPC